MSSAGQVAPDFSAVSQTGLADVVGALLTITLIVAVAMLTVCAIWWAIATSTGNWHQIARARAGVLICLGAAALAGAATAVTAWIEGVGRSL